MCVLLLSVSEKGSWPWCQVTEFFFSFLQLTQYMPLGKSLSQQGQDPNPDYPQSCAVPLQSHSSATTRAKFSAGLNIPLWTMGVLCPAPIRKTMRRWGGSGPESPPLPKASLWLHPGSAHG